MILGSRKKKSVLAGVVDTTTTAARDTGAAVAAEVDNLLGALAGKVSEARERVSTLSDDGAKAARRTLDSAVKETRKAAKQLDKKWKKMDTRQKTLLVGGILAALAAAVAAPAVVRKVTGAKKKR